MSVRLNTTRECMKCRGLVIAESLLPPIGPDGLVGTARATEIVHTVSTSTQGSEPMNRDMMRRMTAVRVATKRVPSRCPKCTQERTFRYKPSYEKDLNRHANLAAGYPDGECLLVICPCGFVESEPVGPGPKVVKGVLEGFATATDKTMLTIVVPPQSDELAAGASVEVTFKDAPK